MRLLLLALTLLGLVVALVERVPEPTRAVDRSLPAEVTGRPDPRLERIRQVPRAELNDRWYKPRWMDYHNSVRGTMDFLEFQWWLSTYSYSLYFAPGATACVPDNVQPWQPVAIEWTWGVKWCPVSTTRWWWWWPKKTKKREEPAARTLAVGE